MNRRFAMNHRSAPLLMSLLLLACRTASAAVAGEAVPIQGGGYRYACDAYQATIDATGGWRRSTWPDRRFSLSPSVNPQVYGASLVWGPDHRTPQDLPNITIESGMVVHAARAAS